MLTSRLLIPGGCVAALLLLTGQCQASGFGFADVRALAEVRAASAYTNDDKPLPKSLAALDYDQINCIEFIREQSIWTPENLPFRMMMYHLGGKLLTHPVDLNQIVHGRPCPILFEPRYYLYHQVPVDVGEFSTNMGFAGFKILGKLNHPERFDEIVSFLGASYFRALGKNHVYGLSARGLAINTVSEATEEFPRFIGFWIERPAPEATNLVVYALMDSTSVSGAYSFDITPGEDTRIRVHAVLFPRRPLEEYGLGALTSMFWHGKNSPDRYGDFRPEVHDSDGLLMARADGVWTWRPLWNDGDIHSVCITNNSPRGFGLIQRDRHFHNYQDMEAHYEIRPSVWIEPAGDWGAGVLRLVELPTGNEYSDNIVAYWRPEQKLVPGVPFEAAWDLHWYTENPAWPPVARCVNTFVAGDRVVLDFAGGLLPPKEGPPPVPVIDVDAGTSSGVHVMYNPDTAGWRIGFIVKRQNASQPVALQTVLRDADGHPLSETWTYQLIP